MKKYTNKLISVILACICSFAILSCKKKKEEVANPVNPNETELITTVKLIVYPNSNTSDLSIFTFRDLDGDGGNKPTIDTIKLVANTEYHLQVLVLDETKNPVDTISKEIASEKNVHEFFYTKIGTYDLATTYLDFDDHNVPVGLNMKINTGTSVTEKTNKLKVVLKHQPGLKPVSGPGDSKLGETDIDIEFPILIH